MKKISFVILYLIYSLMISCAKDPISVDDGFLKSFVLEYQSSAKYFSKIKEDATISFGGIEYGAYVSNVEYTLADGATISPDPKVFVSNWPARQEFTVTKPSGESRVYTVTLSDYKGNVPKVEIDENVLFFTDFTEANGIPDPEVWTLCEKGGSTWNKYMSESYDQAYVKDGNLVLKAEMINGEYKTGGVESIGKKSFKNARFEFRAKFDNYGAGAFPALWLMPNPENQIYQGHPACGEVDVFETVASEYLSYQTIHSYYTLELGIKDYPCSVATDVNLKEYNVFAVEMTEESIVFKINDKTTLVYPNLHLEDEAEKKQWPFSTDFYMILNFALGGPDTWAGPIDDNALPMSMSIDWIKVTDLKPEKKGPVVFGYIIADDHQYDKVFKTIDFTNLTHVAASFCHVRPDGTFSTEAMDEHIDEIRDKAHANNVKVLASFITDQWGDFEKAVQTLETREKLAQGIVDYMNIKNLDGVDIDYEEYDHLEENVPNVLDLFKRIRSKLKPHQLLTSVFNAGTWLDFSADWHKDLDYVNVMIYDGHIKNPTPTQHASYEDYVNEINYCLTHYEMPREKVLGGVPFYGYSWETGHAEAIRYNSILDLFFDEPGVADGEQVGSICYNGRNLIRQKCQYVLNNQIGGVMIWQLCHDTIKEDSKLLDVIGDVLLK